MGWIFELYQNDDDDEHVFTLKDGADVTMLQGAGYVQEANAIKEHWFDQGARWLRGLLRAQC